MFEIVLLELPDPSDGEDRNESRVWCDFFYDSIARSSTLRSILDQPTGARIYNTVLLALYEQWKAGTPLATVAPAPTN
jgi:hypothetical protein